MTNPKATGTPAEDALNAATKVLGAGAGGAPSRPSKVEVEHLDYKYIRECNDEVHLERIYAVLKSGREGSYPDLQEFARQRLIQVKPTSALLRETKQVPSLRDLEQDDRKRLSEDIKSWATGMASKETDSKSATSATTQRLPPVRGQSTASAAKAVRGGSAAGPAAGPTAKPIPGGDFQAWDKYDVDKALEDVDEKPSVTRDRTHINTSPSSRRLPSERIDAAPATLAEREAVANREKIKGNESFRAGDYDEAAVYYTRSLSVHELPATRNNRALVYIKLGRFDEAVTDADVVIAAEPTNIKALARRAAALHGAKKSADAYAAAKRVLELQPNHSEAIKIAKECAAAAAAPKKKRMVIQDVDEDAATDSTAAAPPTTATSPPSSDKPASRRRVVIEEDSESEDDDNTVTLKTPAAPPATRVASSSAVESPAAAAAAAAAVQSPAKTTPTASTSVTTPRGRRVVIEEDSSEDEDDATATKPSASNFPQHSTAWRDVPTTPASKPAADETTPSARSTVSAASVPAPPQAASVPPEILRHKEEGNTAFKAGQYATAVDHYTHALQAISALDCSTSAVCEVKAALLSNRASCHIKNGSCRAALEDCDAGLALGTSVSPKLRLCRGTAHEAMERFADAYADFRESLRLIPGSAAAQAGVNRCGEALRRVHGTEWRKIVPEVQPSDPAPTKPQHPAPHTPPVTATSTSGPASAPAVTQSVGGSATSATVPAPTEVVDVVSAHDTYESLKAKGNELTKKGEFEAAIEIYDKCVEMQPNEIAAINNRALCNLRLGNWSAATRDAASVLAVDPTNTKALLRRAKGLVGLGQLAEAAALCTECLRIEPSNGACTELLGRIREELESKAAVASTATETPDALAELRVQRERLEAERRQAEAEVAKVRGKVDAAKNELAGMKKTMAEKEAVIDEAAKTMQNAVPEIVNDVLAQAQAEGDSKLVAEAKAAKERIEAMSKTKSEGKPMAAPKTSQPTVAAAAPPSTPTPTSPGQKAAIKPWTPAEFMKRFARHRQNPEELAAMLATVDATQLPKLFSNRLEAADITAIFRALEHFADHRSTHAVLRGLVKVKRFDMVGMFLEEADWELADALFDRVKAAVASGEAKDITIAGLEELRARFH